MFDSTNGLLIIALVLMVGVFSAKCVVNIVTKKFPRLLDLLASDVKKKSKKLEHVFKGKSDTM